MRDARAGYGFQRDTPRSRYAAAQADRVERERSTGRMNPAAGYSHADRDHSAMAAGRHGGHAPVAIELGRDCGRSGPDECGSGRQSEGAPTIANHGILIRVFNCSSIRAFPVARPRRALKLGSLSSYKGRLAQPARNAVMQQCAGLLGPRAGGAQASSAKGKRQAAE